MIIPNVTWEDLNMIYRLENERLSQGRLVVERVPQLDADAKRYLVISTLPFAIGTCTTQEDCDKRIRRLWPLTCRTCESYVVFNRAMPIGNIFPTYMFVGDAPGVGIPNGIKEDRRINRAWCIGPSSKLLKMALVYAGIFWSSWLTNLIKCSMPGNALVDEWRFSCCSSYLFNEIETLSPKVVVALGRNAELLLSQHSVKATYVRHPSSYLRNGQTAKDMARDIREVLGC